MDLDLESLDPNLVRLMRLQTYFVAQRTHLWLNNPLATVANRGYFLALARLSSSSRQVQLFCC